MQNTLKKIIQANQEFTTNLPETYLCNDYDDNPACGCSKYPDKSLAIYSCMDTRLVDFLEPAMGIARGEAKVIKAAGNSVCDPFGVIIRSMIVAIYELGVKEILVVGHEDCGMSKSTSKNLIEKMLARGVHPSAIHLVEKELEHWVDSFHEPVDNVVQTTTKIRANPFIPQDVPVHGLMFCPRTGEIKVIVNGYDYKPQTEH